MKNVLLNVYYTFFTEKGVMPNIPENLLVLLAKNYNKVKPNIIIPKQSLKLDNNATFKIEPQNIIINKENDLVFKKRLQHFLVFKIKLLNIIFYMKLS